MMSIRFTAVLATLLSLPSQSAEPVYRPIELEPDAFEHIRFDSIPSNRFAFDRGVLSVEVDSSSSFLMRSFEDILPANKVSFLWRSTGRPAIDDSHMESNREGDDAVFKIGLLISGESPLISFTLKPWLRQVRKLLHHPSEELFYVVAGARHSPGSIWKNPYNDRVRMLSMSSVDDEGGWQRAEVKLPETLDIVAVWLMADGDDTSSGFVTSVSDIRLYNE